MRARFGLLLIFLTIVNPGSAAPLGECVQWLTKAATTLGLPVGPKQLPSQSPEDRESFNQKLQSAIRDEDFVQSRGLTDYLFGLPGLSRNLADFGNNAIWFDLGAGQGNPQRQLLAQLHSLRRLQNQRFFAVAPVIHPTANDPANLQFLQGFIEDVDLSALPKADLITDVYGPSSYSNRLDAVLTVALNQLKIGGEMYIRYDNSRLVFHSKESRKPLDLSDYIQKIGGVKIQSFLFDKRGSYIQIRRTHADISIPALNLLLAEYPEDPPPRYTYLIEE